MDEHIKKKGRRHGPQPIPRVSRYTLEERRAIFLARARKHAKAHNERRKAKKEALLQKRVEERAARPFPSEQSPKIK